MRDLSPFLIALSKNNLNQANFVSAGILFLYETNRFNEAAGITDLVLSHVNPNEQKVKLPYGGWICPSAYAAHLILEKVFLHLGFSQSNLSTLVKKLLPSLYTVQGRIINDKAARSLDAINLEKDFNCMANDLAGYCGVPKNWIYKTRKRAQELSPREIKTLICGYFKNHKKPVPNDLQRRVLELVERDLSIFSSQAN